MQFLSQRIYPFYVKTYSEMSSFQKQLIVSSKHHPNHLYGLGCAQSFGQLELHLKLHVKFTSVRALFWLANEEAGERIGVDAVRGIGPLRMIRRKVNRTAVAAGLGAGASSTGHLCSTECSTEVEGNTVLQHFCAPSYSGTRPE